ncbi:MAG: hypothetical protein Q7J21_08350, partial [Rugosibacter sp.]|nr:hypothetical protein [Rugosibacter sp.]
MENKIIYSKTARGVREAASKTKEVSRELRKVLKAVDGKSNFQTLLAALDGYTEKTLRQAITYLIANGYLRDPDEYGELSASSGGLPALVSHDDDELDFTLIADTPSEPLVVATDEIEAKAKARAKQEAEALKQRKAEEERMQKEAEERVRREAEAQVKQEAEALAR